MIGVQGHHCCNSTPKWFSWKIIARVYVETEEENATRCSCLEKAMQEHVVFL